MNHIKLWVEALESGEYTQATEQLRVDDNFCCLGVACDLYRKKTHRGRWDGMTFVLRGARYVRSLIPLEPEPTYVRRWLGIDISAESRYARMNDRGVAFKEIAKQIREDYKEALA